MQEIKMLIFALTNAEVAQLVELQPSKLVVASSSLVFRSAKKPKHIVWAFFIVLCNLNYLTISDQFKNLWDL